MIDDAASAADAALTTAMRRACTELKRAVHAYQRAAANLIAADDRWKAANAEADRLAHLIGPERLWPDGWTEGHGRYDDITPPQ